MTTADPRIADRASLELRYARVAFGSAAEYLAYPKPDVPACLILDVELPDINGLDLQSQIARGNHPHIVFITGHGDIPSSVRAIKAGAVDFLPKPFKQEDLMRAVECGAGAESRGQTQRRGTGRVASTPVDPDAARTRGAAAGCQRPAQQAGRGRARDQRDHAADPSRQRHEEDGRRILAELVRMAGLLEIPLARSRHPRK